MAECDTYAQLRERLGWHVAVLLATRKARKSKDTIDSTADERRRTRPSRRNPLWFQQVVPAEANAPGARGAEKNGCRTPFESERATPRPRSQRWPVSAALSRSALSPPITRQKSCSGLTARTRWVRSLESMPRRSRPAGGFPVIRPRLAGCHSRPVMSTSSMYSVVESAVTDRPRTPSTGASSGRRGALVSPEVGVHANAPAKPAGARPRAGLVVSDGHADHSCPSANSQMTGLQRKDHPRNGHQTGTSETGTAGDFVANPTND
ncbi:MAG: hypothetical protein OMOMHJEC_02292 [Xanthomonadales bacterium]|nr:hypothetical protein [Xanthomonadales bacterium]